MSDKKLLVTICGPSTTGKSHLSDFFKKDNYQGVVTTTTRPPRTGEIDGIHYYFVSEEKFQEMIKNDELVENAKVGLYSYGLSKAAIKATYNSTSKAVLVLEPSGANKVAQFCTEQGIDNHKVYLNNSVEVLTERLISRYETDAKAQDDVYKDRLWNLVVLEPKNWTAPAYSGEHHYHQIFDTFIKDNQHQVYKEICNNINNRLNINITKIKI